MPKQKLTRDEILAAEKGADDRRKMRLLGLNKRHERDQAVKVLSNGAVMVWHVPKELNEARGMFLVDDKEVEIVTYPPNIPEDSFGLDIGGKMHLFNIEEFRTWLRWA